MSQADLPAKKNQFVHKLAFFGYASTEPGEELYDQAFAAARHMAKLGYVIVDGGGPGVMAAATLGAEEVGGQTEVVTFYPQDAPGFEGKYMGNIADKEIVTDNYIERMYTLMAESDFYVIFNGGTGTLSEFATAWVLARLYQGHHKGFVLYGDFWRPIVKVLTENMMIRPNATDLFEIVTKPEEIQAAIEKFEQQMAGTDHSHCAFCKEKAFMT